MYPQLEQTRHVPEAFAQSKFKNVAAAVLS